MLPLGTGPQMAAFISVLTLWLHSGTRVPGRGVEIKAPPAGTSLAIIYGPADDKTYNKTCVTSEDSDQHQSLRWSHLPSTASGLSKVG